MPKRALPLLLLAASLLSAAPEVSAQAKPPAASEAKPVRPAPAEIYGALPGVRTARLSPDGKLLALIVPIKEKNTMVVWDLENKGKSQALPTGEFEPEWFVWKTNRRLVAGLRFYSLRTPLHPSVDTRLIAVDVDGKNALDLVNAEQFKTHIPQIQDKVVSWLPNDEEHILIELPAIDRVTMRPGQTTGVGQYGSMESRLKYPEVARVDINTGRLQTVFRPHGWVISWRADAAGNVRLGRSLREKIVSYEVRNPADDSWRTIQSFEINKGRTFNPLAFVDGNPNRLYALSNHEGGPGALYEFDVPSDSFVRKIAANPRNGVVGIVHNGRLLGYETAADAPPVYLDETYAREAKIINQALPDSQNVIVDRSTDGKRVLFHVTRGNEPSAYWLLDRASGKNVLTPVAETYPDLEPEQVAASRMVYYKARDGLEIPALLTLPPGHNRAAGALPFVVLPHGGPTSHDTSGFNYLAQFIASRGYGVLQPQFRGSSGYGAAFEAAGLQQWGLAMQDDLTDGTRWLIDQKLADPARIAIVGGSYGGYAALMGAVKEPGLYRCAAAVAPVADLKLLVDDSWHYLFSDVNVPRIGTDTAILEKTSPAHNAERIRIPLLLVHGRKDYTVPVEHTVRMAEALQKAGKPAEVVFLDQADHFLSRGSDRLATLKALEKFLAANLAAPLRR